MFTSSGESEGAYFIRDHNFVNMFTLQKCLCWTDKGFVPKRNGKASETPGVLAGCRRVPPRSGIFPDRHG